MIQVKLVFKTARNRLKSDRSRLRKEIDKLWYGVRVVDECNKLSREVIVVDTLGGVKHRSDRHMTDNGWVSAAAARRPPAVSFISCYYVQVQYFLCYYVEQVNFLPHQILLYVTSMFLSPPAFFFFFDQIHL